MLNNLNQLLTLTSAMLSAAEQQDWESVAHLQLKREQLTRKTEALPMPENRAESDRAGDLITEIQQIEALIAPLLLKQKSSLIDETLQNNKGRKMNKAYQTYK